MKRTIIIIIVLTVVIGLGVGGYIFLTPKTYSVADDPSVSEILTIETDTIIATVDAAGRLEAIDDVELSFDMSGKVEAVYVEEGDQIEAGFLLAELDAAGLTYAFQLAELELSKAQIQLEQLQVPPAEVEVKAAQAALDSANIALSELLTGAPEAEMHAAEVAFDSAQANLQKVLSGPDANSVVVAAANLKKMELALRQAQFAYDAVAYDSRAANAQGIQLEQATIDYETALANYNLAVKEADNADILAAQTQVANAASALEKLRLNATPSQVASAQVQVIQAEASLRKLLTGPSAADIALAQAGIETAQLNLEKARHELEQAQLRSPIAGTITSLNVKPNTIPQPNEPLIKIADFSTFKLVVEVDEVDISQIAVGQPVIINLDSLPEETYPGRVDEIGIAPAAGESSGIVAYPVTILIDDTGDAFKIGMNVNATIETERLEDVVVVQNRAIEIDRQTGQAFVEKLVDDQTTGRVEITLGRRSSNVSQVLAGLTAGDQIIIRKQNRRDELRRAIQGDGN